jgi:hypothetical protein
LNQPDARACERVLGFVFFSEVAGYGDYV